MKFGVSGLLMVTVLAAPGAASAATYRWSGNAAGDWNVPANWVLVEGPAGAGYPNLPGDVASIEGTLPSPTTITIPDAVAVSIGRLTLSADQSVTIANGGTGLLVFDNAGQNAVLVSSSLTHRLSAPVRLDSDLDIRSFGQSVVFAGGITEGSAGRGVISRQGNGTFVYEPVANTYTGPTSLETGRLSTASSDPAVVTVPGDLIVGTSNALLTFAEIHAGALAPGADVTVRGQLEFRSNGNQAQSQTIDDLTILRGNTYLNRVVLDAATLTMEGGILRTGLDAGVVVHGDVSATSTTVPAKILHYVGESGTLRLDSGGTHTLTVAAGPSDQFHVDAVIAIPIVGAGGEGLTKQGAGRAALLRNNTYSGPTTIAAGTLFINGEQPASPVTISGGTLAGVGIVGAVTATSGNITPGGTVTAEGIVGSTTGVLRTGSVTIGAGTTLHADVDGAAAFDQLDVTGTVDVTNATLVVTAPFQGKPAQLAAITIVKNDGADPVQGIFDGLPEGTAINMPHGVRYTLSYSGGDGNDIVLTNTTPLSYFLSEGSTGTFFEEHVLIANANTVGAPITLTFLLPGGGTVVRSRVVAPQSRLTIDVADIPGLEAVSASVRVVSDGGVPLAVERTMFWDHTRYGGHTDSATGGPSTSWNFAEGSQGFFDTFLLLANANDVPAQASITFLREADSPITDTVTLAPFSRRTVYAGDYAALVNRSFGISVSATQPIAAERSMYFGSTPTRLWSGGHNTHGTVNGSDFWFHAEGATGTFFSTFILLSNPDTAPKPFLITFLLPDGQKVVRSDVIGPNQRLTINPAFESPLLQNASFSTMIQGLPFGFPTYFVSERAMYWPGEALPWGEGHVNLGTGLARVWDLAEGRVGGPESFATYILLANPRSTPANVTVTFLRESGAPIVKTYTVGATSRFNIDVASMVPELQNENFGARVEVTTVNGVIAVERSMYWNVNGVMWAGGTNASGIPQQ